MDDEEFLTWAAYMQIEPFGDDRADWRAAAMMAQEANMNRKKGAAPYPVGKFLLRFRAQERREKTMDELKMALWSQYVAMGGNRKRG